MVIYIMSTTYPVSVIGAGVLKSVEECQHEAVWCKMNELIITNSELLLILKGQKIATVVDCSLDTRIQT